MKGRYGRFSRVKANAVAPTGSGISSWKLLLIMFATLFIPWGIYVILHPRFSSLSGTGNVANIDEAVAIATQEAKSQVDQNSAPPSSLSGLIRGFHLPNMGGGSGSGTSSTTTGAGTDASTGTGTGGKQQAAGVVSSGSGVSGALRLPVLGPIVKNGAKPLYGIKHKGTDAIFALACNYNERFYQRFVGTLRDTGYNDDIVLAVSPPAKMAPGVGDYVKAKNVVAYAFEVDCDKKDSCRFKDDFLGYPDPRPYRTFANIRYALYEYWLRYYSANSYVLILDFRDTFFQGQPFIPSFGKFESRTPKYELHVFAENFKVKWIKKCVYNSLWVGRCFGPEALAAIGSEAVLCSGSTLGSFQGIDHYVSTMLRSMDKVQCWRKGIESDQGYQNYLYYNGRFDNPHGVGNATFNHQGYGVVNTIGAMNGRRVPADQKGPLDTFWKIRDKEGYILNYDGTRSAVVHQWDRYYSEIVNFLDRGLLKLNVRPVGNTH